MTRRPNLAIHLLSVILVCVCATADAQSAKECQEGDPLGSTYLGNKSVTTSGLSCQVWSTSIPHKHQYTDLGDHNHCRNPDKSFDGGVWCYTTDLNRRRKYVQSQPVLTVLRREILWVRTTLGL